MGRSHVTLPPTMIPRFRPWLLVAMFCVACPKQAPAPLAPVPAPIQQDLAAEVQALALRAEKLLAEQQELIWKNWIDGTPVEINKTYRGTESLFSLESIRKIEQLRSNLLEQLQCVSHQQGIEIYCANPASVQQLRALTHLHMHFVGEYLSLVLSEQNEAIANLEASLSFSVKGKDYAYRDLERLLATEKNDELRHALYAAATRAQKRLAQSIQRRDEKAEGIIRDLGYPSYPAFGQEMRQTDLAALGAIAEEVLDRTQARYLDLLETLGQSELRVSRDRLQRSDLTRIFRARADAPLAKAELLAKVDKTLGQLGMPLGELKNITLDLSELKTKNSLPITLPIAVPRDIRVSVKPVGTIRDALQLFRELGRALPYSFIDNSLGTGKQPTAGLKETRFELTKLGNRTLNESYSLLIEGVAENPRWLEESAGIPRERVNAQVAASSARRLYQLRRRAGHFLYEMQLHPATADQAREAYVRTMSRAYGVAFGPEDAARAMTDQDELYRSADDLRASFLAAQLKAHLVAQFGSLWWSNPDAAKLLQGLWARGTSLSADEIAQRLGERAVSPKELLDQATRAAIY